MIAASGSLVELFRLDGQAPDEFLPQALARIAQYFDATGASLFIQSEDPTQYQLVAAHGSQATLPDDVTIQMGRGVGGAVLARGRGTCVLDPLDDPELALSTEALRPDLGSALVLPLLVDDQPPVGLLNISRSPDQRAFGGLDLKEAEAIGNYLALAVLSARQANELKQLEEAKRLAQIGQMTAAVAHEIRNPLTSLLAAAQMVEEDPESLSEFLPIIQTEAKRLEELCEDFLQFARPYKIERIRTDLVSLVREVVRRKLPEFESSKIKLEFECDVHAQYRHIDAFRIDQVIENLLRNAREASDPGTGVTVCITEQSLSITDQGCGMDRDQIARLGSPFFTTKAAGTGLGLTNVKKILNAHQAKLKIESEPGIGTCFEIVWPAHREEGR